MSLRRSSHGLAPLRTAHAAAAWFCRLPENIGDGMDNLSRYDREECNGHVRFNVEDTGMGGAAGVVRREPTPDFTELHALNSPCAARPRRSHSLLTILKPAQES